MLKIRIVEGNSTKCKATENFIPKYITYPVTNNTQDLKKDIPISVAQLEDVEQAKEFVDHQSRL